MNDLPWIKYLPREMFLDTLGMTDSGERAHRRLCDYIWFSDMPPVNDNEVLKQISQTSPQNWGRTKLELLGKGWMEREGFFTHPRAIRTLNEAKELFVSNQNRTLAANNARKDAVRKPLLALTPPDPKTGVRNIVTEAATPPVTGDVTTDVTMDVTSGQVQEQLQEQNPTIADLRSDPGGCKGGAAAANGRLDADGALQLARQILANGGGWFYDNCRVKREAFTVGSLVSVLRGNTRHPGYLGRLTAAQALACFRKAVVNAHQDSKDFEARDPVRNPAALCVAEWRKLMDAKCT